MNKIKKVFCIVIIVFLNDIFCEIYIKYVAKLIFICYNKIRFLVKREIIKLKNNKESNLKKLASGALIASIITVGEGTAVLNKKVYASGYCKVGTNKPKNSRCTYQRVNQQESEKVGDCQYKVVGKTATLIKCTNKAVETIEIPAEVSVQIRGGGMIKCQVTKIGDYAFKDCKKLKSIKIPESVTSIGDYAFKGCKKLTSIKIPESVKSISDSAFNDCIILMKLIFYTKNWQQFHFNVLAGGAKKTIYVDPQATVQVGRFKENFKERIEGSFLGQITVPDKPPHVIVKTLKDFLREEEAAEEEAAKKAAEEEAAKKAAEEEAARKKSEEEAEEKRKAEEAAKKAAEEAEEKRKAEEEAARKKAEEEAARKKAEEEAAKKEAAKKAAEAKKKAEEEVKAEMQANQQNQENTAKTQM